MQLSRGERQQSEDRDSDGVNTSTPQSSSFLFLRASFKCVVCCTTKSFSHEIKSQSCCVYTSTTTTITYYRSASCATTIQPASRFAVFVVVVIS